MKYKYYGYCPDSGFETFETENEAIRYAQDSIDYYRNCASEGWDENVNFVSWGEIKQTVVMFDEMSIEEAQEQKGITVSSCCSGYCDYKLEDL